MTWVALILYILPVAAYLRDFDFFYDMARDTAPSKYSEHAGMITLVAAFMIAFWPIGMALDLVFGEN